MLALTPNAAEAVQMIVGNAELPESAGLRLQAQAASANGDGPMTLLTLDVVPAPEPDDTVVPGAPLYVDPDATDLVDDQVLDVELRGGEDLQFSIHPQAPDGQD
jgi:Fe-S cluster assembly iron-binding protein IscA